MATFKAFFEMMKQDKQLYDSQNLLPDSQILVPMIAIEEPINESISNILDIGVDTRNKFSEQLEKHINSEEFIEKLSAAMQEPLENETEEEFVARASDTLRKLLYKKFKIK